MGFYNDLSLSYTNEDAELDRRDGITPSVATDWNALAREYAQSYQISFYAAQADITRRRNANGDSEAARWFRRVFAGEKLAWSTTA